MTQLLPANKYYLVKSRSRDNARRAPGGAIWRAANLNRGYAALSHRFGLRARPRAHTEGNLAPDNIVIGLVEDRLGNTDCGAGAVFDGFPRTLPQAEALDDGSQGVARRSPILLN